MYSFKETKFLDFSDAKDLNTLKKIIAFNEPRDLERKILYNKFLGKIYPPIKPKDLGSFQILKRNVEIHLDENILYGAFSTGGILLDSSMLGEAELLNITETHVNVNVQGMELSAPIVYKDEHYVCSLSTLGYSFIVDLDYENTLYLAVYSSYGNYNDDVLDFFTPILEFIKQILESLYNISVESIDAIWSIHPDNISFWTSDIEQKVLNNCDSEEEKALFEEFFAGESWGAITSDLTVTAAKVYINGEETPYNLFGGM